MGNEQYTGAARSLALLARVVERAAGDLTLPQYRVLSLIESGDERASLVAGRLVLTKPTVSALVDTLAERNLLERHAVAGDRRSVQLLITATGRAALAQAEQAMAHELERLLDGVAHRDALLDGLAELDSVLRSEVRERIRDRFAARPGRK